MIESRQVGQTLSGNYIYIYVKGIGGEIERRPERANCILLSYCYVFIYSFFFVVYFCVLTLLFLIHNSNKGAVAISVLFGSRSLLFINCHLRGIRDNNITIYLRIEYMNYIFIYTFSLF